MNNKLLLLTITILALCSCINNNSHHQKQSTINTDTTANISTSPFVEGIDRRVGEFIQYIKELELGIPLTKEVFTLYFYNKDGNTYVTMFVLPYYMKEKIEAYTYVNDYTFAYYGEENIGDKYINKNMLLPYQDTLPGFLDYDKFPLGHYEPYGIEFQIINSDSLLMVRKGMLQ